MNKDEHIVFKCTYDTLGEDLAKKFGVKVNSFVYFYIISIPLFVSTLATLTKYVS